ncbi:MAG: hypothetical protein DHS20C01_34190 [marine bacterium B5-7]|nr:MAG: hypothetical protein DHS20C01_34190 [marine bacterium B5-7]
MSIVIFTGPSLNPKEAEKQLDAHYLPPVKQGDLYRAVRLFKPRCVGIIDGYFSQVPAIWHKEILWALSNGIKIFGAASMGALRAAELDGYGMQGVGDIYTAYRQGSFPPYSDDFENDDEVAVIHGPAELDYKALSEPLVNIRATLAAANRHGVIDTATRDYLVGLVKNRFYPDRNFNNMLVDASENGSDHDLLSKLEQWIGLNKVDLKHRDALLLVREITNADGKPATFCNKRFECTTLWDRAIQEINILPAESSPVLDELRLLGEQYFELRDSVLDELINEMDSNGHVLSDSAMPDSWFAIPMRQRQLISYREAAPSHWLTGKMMARIAKGGDLDILESRANDKQQKLVGRSVSASDLTDLELLQLMDWYFEQQLKVEMPDSIDEYAAQLGGLEVESFYNLVLREYYYLHPDT